MGYDALVELHDCKEKGEYEHNYCSKVTTQNQDQTGNEFDEIKSYLVTLGLIEGEIEATAQLILTHQRTLADFERLAHYARSKNPEHAIGTYIVVMIKKNRYSDAKAVRNKQST